MIKDIFFISFTEANCESNWHRLLQLHHNAIRIHGVKGIDRAHAACENLSTSEFFWTIDGDNWITERLDWEENPDNDLTMFHSIDPLYDDFTLLGGVKLWRKNSITNKNLDKIDFSLNATKNKKIIDKTFSITKYNTTPFDAWKTSFRHCVKLSSCIFRNRPHASNIERYLLKWKNTASLNKENAQWAFKGYLDALEFTKHFDNNLSELSKINDFDWLKNSFVEKYDRS